MYYMCQVVLVMVHIVFVYIHVLHVTDCTCNGTYSICIYTCTTRVRLYL